MRVRLVNELVLEHTQLKSQIGEQWFFNVDSINLLRIKIEKHDIHSTIKKKKCSQNFCCRQNDEIPLDISPFINNKVSIVCFKD